MGSLRLFLDANVLFSAALGGASFELLWVLAAEGRAELVTTRYCVTEAHRNLARKRPGAKARLTELLASVIEVPDPTTASTAHVDLPPKDAPVYAAAVATAADVLITGDRKHFGRLMDRHDLPLRVRTLRTFLIEGPDPGGVRRPSEAR